MYLKSISSFQTNWLAKNQQLDRMKLKEEQIEKKRTKFMYLTKDLN